MFTRDQPQCWPRANCSSLNRILPNAAAARKQWHGACLLTGSTGTLLLTSAWSGTDLPSCWRVTCSPGTGHWSRQSLSSPLGLQLWLMHSQIPQDLEILIKNP